MAKKSKPMAKDLKSARVKRVRKKQKYRNTEGFTFELLRQDRNSDFEKQAREFERRYIKR